MKQSLHKIQGFLNFLEECESEEQLYSEIEMYHKLFQQESANNGALIEKVLARETDAGVKALLARARAASLLGSEDAAQRLQAVQQLAQLKTPETQLLLNQLGASGAIN